MKTLILATFIASSLPALAATVIYEHSFSGSSSNSLNDVALDTANAVLGGSNGATWLASEPRFFADGHTTASVATTPNTSSAYVAFSPVDGYQYTIAMDVGVTSASTVSDWIALSLIDGTPDTTRAFFQHTSFDPPGSFDAYASVGRRHSGYSGVTFLDWQGPGNSGPSNHLSEDEAGVWTLSILLDTTNAGAWTYQVRMQGDNGAEQLSSTYNLGPAASGNIDYFMITNHNRVAGTLDNFSITAVPEPTSALLLGLGLFPFARRQR